VDNLYDFVRFNAGPDSDDLVEDTIAVSVHRQITAAGSTVPFSAVYQDMSTTRQLALGLQCDRSDALVVVNDAYLQR